MQYYITGILINFPMESSSSRLSDRQRIRAFFVEQCFLGADTLDLERGLFSTGVLSSLDLIDLMAYLEEEFGFKIEPLEAEMKNFDTVDLVLGFIARKQASE